MGEGLVSPSDSASEAKSVRSLGAGLQSFVPWGLFSLEKVLSCSRQGARQGGSSSPPDSAGVFGAQLLRIRGGLGQNLG